MSALVSFPGSKWIASGSADGTVILSDTNGRVWQEWVATYASIRWLALSPDGHYLSCTDGNHDITIWDLSQDAHRLAALWSPKCNFKNCAWSPDGTMIASSTDDGTLCLWDAETFQLRHYVEDSGQAYSIFHTYFISFSPNGRWIVTDREHRNCRIWNVESGTLHRELCGHINPLNAARFDPTSTRLATASWDWTVRVWDVKTGEQLFVMDRHTDHVWDVSFSPDGNLVVSASWDFTVRIWDAFTGGLLLSLKGHSNRVEEACFSPCGVYVASASDDKTVRLWRTSDGTCIATFTEHEGHVSFSPDGQTLWVGARDGNISVRRIADIVQARS